MFLLADTCLKELVQDQQGKTTAILHVTSSPAEQSEQDVEKKTTYLASETLRSAKAIWVWNVTCWNNTNIWSFFFVLIFAPVPRYFFLYLPIFFLPKYALYLPSKGNLCREIYPINAAVMTHWIMKVVTHYETANFTVKSIWRSDSSDKTAFYDIQLQPRDLFKCQLCKCLTGWPPPNLRVARHFVNCTRMWGSAWNVDVHWRLLCV